MPDSGKGGHLVEVMRDGVTVDALWKPEFIIKMGEKYYLTLAVWEYDHHPGETEQQREGVHEVVHLFEDGLKAGRLKEAVLVIPPIGPVDGTQTGPVTPPPPRT